MNNPIMKRLDGKHRLAIVGALVAWGLSMWFSYQGFKLESSTLLWVGWILAFLVTIVELVFNSPTRDLSFTLIIIGILCYGYGVWTNITGFWSVQHPGMDFNIFTEKAVLSVFVGTILEILPEPLFMWGIGSLGADVLDNLRGLWSGEYGYAKPTQGSQNKQEQEYKQQHHPGQPSPKHNGGAKAAQGRYAQMLKQKQGQGKTVSPIFDDGFAKRFKNQ